LSAEQGFGYFPAYPGLALKKDRYKVIRKLGYGPRSSVWLVSDLQGEKGYSALKILTVHSTSEKTQELGTLKTIRERPYYDLPNLHDNFLEQSHHGKHQCFVLSVLGSDVESLRLTSPTKSLPVHMVQKAIASVLEPLSDLHDSGIAHCAVTANNFLFFAGQTVEDLEPKLKHLPPSVIERTVTVGEVEYPIVLSQPIPHGFKWNDSRSTIYSSSIYLNNVAHSQWTRGNPTWEKAKGDVALRPPEVILGTAFNIKVDTWMLGCAAYQLLTGEPLVPSKMTEDDNDQLAWMMAMAGDCVNKTMALESERRDEFFYEDGIFIDDIPETNLTAALTASGKVAEQDIPEIVEFIETCLSLDPADRPTAGALMGHSWIKNEYACSCGYPSCG